MPNPVNLLSLINGKRTLPHEIFQSYLEYNRIIIKDTELQDYSVFVFCIGQFGFGVRIFSNYYIGYSIPQIGKEFDILRFGLHEVFNIEIKSTASVEKIKKQLLLNKYYLSFLNTTVFNYCFVSDVKTLYFLNENDELIVSNLSNLASLLANQKLLEIPDINIFFNPSKFLVSPFNNQELFISGKYFLTPQQSNLKKEIKSIVSNQPLSILGVTGGPGTGKTLLTYDIAKELKSSSKLLIVHCGRLNVGHYSLIDKYNWPIIAIKDLPEVHLSSFSIVIIDEAQRIYKDTFHEIIAKVQSYNLHCLFSLDNNQTLNRYEIGNNILEELTLKLTNPMFKLTKTIRSNKEICAFIDCIINLNIPIPSYIYNSVEIQYFSNSNTANDFINFKKLEGYQWISYTPTKYGFPLPYERFINNAGEENAHTVIGQEFENVVAVIDDYFFYKKGKLSTRNYKSRPYYHPTKMLYQILSRARSRLCIVIVSNPEVLRRCLEIKKSGHQ